MLVPDIPAVLSYLPPLASLLEVCRRYYAAHDASQAVLKDRDIGTIPPCPCGACEMMRVVFEEAGPTCGEIGAGIAAVSANGAASHGPERLP